MGKNKKGHNWKSRQNVSGHLDDRETKLLETKVAIEVDKSQGYGESNQFVLPSAKRKFIKEKEAQVSRILSKRQRKNLEKIIDKKKKKSERSQLIEKLQSVQVPDTELALLTSLSTIQTKGLKRQFAEDEWVAKMKEEGKEVERVETSQDNCDDVPVKKIRLRTKLKVREEENLEPVQNGKDVLGFDSSGSDEESDEEDDVVEGIDEKEPDSPKLPEPVNVSPNLVENDTKEKTDSKPKSVKTFSMPTRFVPVYRTAEIQSQREKLPILSEEQPIMEAIRENDILILAGETGSGKTTQVPQFLFEAGYALEGLIGVTEPRRVAAMAMAARVGEEMSLGPDVVSYQIRFEGTTTESTKIRFITDGVLLREVEKDYLLQKYSVIIIDEAHERSVFSDVLISLLSRIVVKRSPTEKPLKLIIMSATLRIEDFTENRKLFANPPPVIKVDSRQFEVKVHFNRRTPVGEGEYVEEAFKKVCKIHRTLPDGGILVFLTGQQEVKCLVQRLKKLFPPKSESNLREDEKGNDLKVEEGLKNSLQSVKKRSNSKKALSQVVPQVDLNRYCTLPTPDDTEADASAEFKDDLDLDDDLDDEIVVNEGLNKFSNPLWVLPLYSLLSSDRQNRVFQPPPEGHRLCVIATNVAETSLTIPGIKYVVDSGKVKTKFYDKVTGVSTFLVTWTSKAQANQRAGRAGRTGPGHCYRLYSSAVFDSDFKEHAQPEILTRPVEDLVLLLKSMFIDNVVNFPFPTPPDQVQIKTAERKLLLLGALEPPPKNINKKEHEKLMSRLKISKLGKAMSSFPLAPRFGKMLALSHQHNLMPYTITMVSALSLQEVLLERPIGDFTDSLDKTQIIQLRKTWLGQGHSMLLGDPMVLIRAVGAAEYGGVTQEFCDRYALRFKAMIEIRKLRRQLTNEVNMIMPDLNLALDPTLKPPTDLQSKLLRQILLSGLPDQIAKRVDEQEIKEGEDKQKFRYAYLCPEMEEPIYLHETCVLREVRPEFVAFQEIFETTKMYMRTVTAIEPEWLPTFCPELCNFSEPLSDPEPFYDSERGEIICTVNATFSSRAWQLPRSQIVYPLGIEKYKLFAKFFLEGKVINSLEKFTKEMLSNPIVMVKSWANLHGKRTQIILEELVKNEVHNYQTLEKACKKQENFLKTSYLAWVPESLKEAVSSCWPLLPISKPS